MGADFKPYKLHESSFSPPARLLGRSQRCTSSENQVPEVLLWVRKSCPSSPSFSSLSPVGSVARPGPSIPSTAGCACLWPGCSVRRTVPDFSFPLCSMSCPVITTRTISLTVEQKCVLSYSLVAFRSQDVMFVFWFTSQPNDRIALNLYVHLSCLLATHIYTKLSMENFFLFISIQTQYAHGLTHLPLSSPAIPSLF